MALGINKELILKAHFCVLEIYPKLGNIGHATLPTHVGWEESISLTCCCD